MAKRLVTIALPDHAVRYLVGMLQSERHALSQVPALSAHELGLLAHYDSLNALESAIPMEFWNE